MSVLLNVTVQTAQATVSNDHAMASPFSRRGVGARARARTKSGRLLATGRGGPLLTKHFNCSKFNISMQKENGNLPSNEMHTFHAPFPRKPVCTGWLCVPLSACLPSAKQTQTARKWPQRSTHFTADDTQTEGPTSCFIKPGGSSTPYSQSIRAQLCSLFSCPTPTSRTGVGVHTLERSPPPPPPRLCNSPT